MCLNSYAAPIIGISPRVVPNAISKSQTPIEFTIPLNQQGTYIYQLKNNTKYTLSNLGLSTTKMPANVSIIPSHIASLSCNSPHFTCQYCSDLTTLAPGATCLIKVAIKGTIDGQHLSTGPVICNPANKSVYCNAPLVKPLFTKVEQAPLSCNANVANFNKELSYSLDVKPNNKAWGPSRNHLPMSSANPDLRQCVTTDPQDSKAVSWMERRVMDLEDFWVRQKLNYCHHHVPDYATTPAFRPAKKGGGYCSVALDIYPGTPYYNKPVRWNYSGKGVETIDNWIKNQFMWFGVDCSNFTSFVYNMAFGIQFNSDTGFQAGQAEDGSQDVLTPNSQTAMDQLRPFDDNNPNSPAGVLVCKDGKTEVEEPHCGGFGANGYFSVFVPPFTHPHHPRPTPSNITDADLRNLQPGDLIYLGFAGSGGTNPTSMVTHVITWTGKHVGTGPNDIPADKIAPESICPTKWKPIPGNGENEWVIIDSHYQGPDYRILTKCFYQNNIWGVRRVIGYMTPKF